MAHIVIGLAGAIAALIFAVLWMIERTTGAQREGQAVYDATRELRIALRYIACLDAANHTPAGHFAIYFFAGDKASIDRHFPDFQQFHDDETDADKVMETQQ